MADDLVVVAGTVATDDASGAHVQIVKLAQSADGSRTAITADAGGLLVNLGTNNDVVVTGVATEAKQDTIIGHVDGIEALLGTIDADTGSIMTAVQLIDNAIAGTEMQVDVVAALPAGDNNIGNVDIVTLPATPAGTNLIGAVNLRPHTTTITAASSSLTTATTAYTSGDQLGAIRTIASAARVSGGTGIIRGIKVLDEGDILSLITVFIYRATVTLAGDNAAYSVSDADTRLLVWRGQIAFADDGGQRIGFAQPYAPFDCTASDLFIGVRTDTSHTFFAAATDLPITLWIAQD